MRAVERYNIQVEIGGVQYGGWYEVDKGLVRVRSPYGSKATQIGGTPADVLARTLLRELIEAEKRRPGS